MPPARILLADDDRFFRDVVGAQLAALGHEVVRASSGAEALAAVRSGDPFDLVLADVVMPGLDGIQLTGELRRGSPDLEIILVTSLGDVQAAIEALRAGASDYLIKPVEESVLADRVRRSLERSALRREKAQLLSENLEFVRSQALLHRCLEMLSLLDLERLQEVCLADLCHACDAQSGALWVAEEGGDLTLRAYRGLVERSMLMSRIASRDGPFGEKLGRGEPFEAPGRGLGNAFYLPLRAAGELVGLVLCADRLGLDFGDAELSAARSVGSFAGTALRNARRYAAMERVGLRDRETSAYNLAYFSDYAGKEAYKARRYGRVFSILTLSLDGLAAFRESRGAEKASALARSVIATLTGAVRDSDVVAKAADDEFYVLLPETDHLGALVFARRARAALARDEAFRAAGAAGQVSPALGAATFPRDGQDFDELLHACRRRTEEARRSLARRLDLAKLDFWSSAELLLGDESSPRLPTDDRAGPSRRGLLPPRLFGQLQLELALEIGRDPRARGLLYVGCGEVRADAPAVAALAKLPPDCGTHVYLLGRRGDLGAQPWATPVYLDGDERMARHEFLLLYSENAAYALIQRRAAQGAPWGFHSSDATLVDELVAKLQEAYDLQPL